MGKSLLAARSRTSTGSLSTGGCFGVSGFGFAGCGCGCVGGGDGVDLLNGLMALMIFEIVDCGFGADGCGAVCRAALPLTPPDADGVTPGGGGALRSSR